MLSIPHLIIIFVVALVVFGPEKLPELARNLGKVMGEFKKATGELRYTLEDHLRELERETEQRRIGGPAVLPAPAAPGSVPTAAPNAPTDLEGSSERQQPQSGQPEADQQKPNPENVSDGGTRPA